MLGMGMLVLILVTLMAVIEAGIAICYSFIIFDTVSAVTFIESGDLARFAHIHLFINIIIATTASNIKCLSPPSV